MLRLFLETVRRIQYLFHRNRVDAELREELATHVAMASQDSDSIAASRRVGNLTRWREISKDAWGWGWLESLGRDIGYGLRLLVKSPGFTITACLSLAIGLGATMGIFSLTNALLFKTLPVPAAEQLWGLGHANPEERDDTFSYPMFAALCGLNRTGIPFFAAGSDNLEVEYGNSARKIPALIVSGEAFPILQVKPYAGRLLNRDDDVTGIPHGANCVLSYRLWRSWFHADLGAVGSHMKIGKQTFTVIGIAPPSFFGIEVGAHAGVILPIAGYAGINPAKKVLDGRGWTWLSLIARVPPRMSVTRLAAELNTIYPQVWRESAFSPDAAAKPDRLYLESAATGISGMRDRFAKPLYILLTMTGLILLIVCANIANLLLARSVVREKEVAVRISLGAGRGRVLRQLLTESALIAVVGVIASIPIYLLCTRGLLLFLRSADANAFLDISPDWRVLAGAFAMVCCTVLLFGFAPAIRATRCDLNSALSETSGRLSTTTLFGKVVVAVQIGLSLILLLGASLLSRSLYDLRTFDPGFRRDHLLIGDVDVTQSIHKNAEVIRFFDGLLSEIRVLPEVRSAAASVVVPLSGMSWQDNYVVAGDAATKDREQHAFENFVTPGFFETLGTPLLLGRNLNNIDTAKSALVAVVNESFAKRAFGEASPIGHRFHEKDKKEAITIIGLARDARYRRLQDNVPPTVYRPVAQLPVAFEFLLTLNLEVWTNTSAASVSEPIHELVKRLNPEVSIETHTFDTLIDANLLYERLLTALSIAFGAVGLVLSVIGVYGLCAYSVARRTSEVGIRMALGATPAGVLRMILYEYTRLLAVGVIAGLAVSLAMTRFLRAWLFGVSPTDPLLYCVGFAVLITAALFAALVPARRAAHLNPLVALRHE